MEKFITTLRPNNVIDKDSASDNILSFIISSVKNNQVSKENFYNLLPSIYSFCYHQKLEEGNTLGEIEFKEDDKYSDNNNVSAFSFANEVHFCPAIFQGESEILNVIDLIDSTFHEINHVGEYTDSSLRSDTHEFHNFHFGNIQEESISIYLKLCQRHIGEDGIFKCPNEFAFEDKGNEISDYLTKLYFFDENEQNARSFATTSILKLMEYSETKEFDKLDSDSLQAFRIAHFNFHLVNKSNMLNIKHFELRDVTKMELYEYTKKLHSDLKEYIPLRREIENATTIDEKARKISLVKINQLISNAEMNIVGMLGVNYDETLANDFAETILSINEEFSETSPIAFTKLIETTKFSPTKEQFIRGAKVFRTNFNDNNDLNNICEFSTPLTPFVHSLSTCYNPEILLRTYALDNNEFLSDLIKYDHCLIPLDKETLDKVKADYLNNSLFSNEDEVDLTANTDNVDTSNM